MFLFGNIYQYIAVCFGSTFLVPQIFVSYKSRTLKNVSSITLIYIVIGSSIWCYYMFKLKEKWYMYASGFLSLNGMILICMKIHEYYIKLKEQVKQIALMPIESNHVTIQIDNDF